MDYEDLEEEKMEKVDPDEGPEELMEPDTSLESETVEHYNELRDANQ